MKKYLILSVFVLILPFFIFGCDKEQIRTSYQISCVYDDESQSLTCEQTVNYVNISNNTFTEIWFNIYANAFREDAKFKPVSTANIDKAYPNGESYGCIEISSVTVEENLVEYKISGNDENVLIVPIETELFPEETVKIYISYTIKLANINHRLGYGENTVNLGNFFPIACVYENGFGFVCNKYVANGDPFYSDVANFEVNIDVPENFKVASTGNLKTESNANGRKIVYSKADNVRDFCAVLSDKFEIKSAKAGGITVNYYYFDDEQAQSHLDLAIEALITFSEMFGNYPYNTFTLVKADFCFGGMEYPNLIYISSDIVDNETYNYVIVHEIAHQWWYGVVGNDEYSDAWVDEGLTEYSTALFFERHEDYGFKYDTIIENATDSYKLFVKVYKNILGDVDESMDRNLSQYLTEPEYVNCIYTKGMLMFDNLRSTIGDKKFFNCLKEYYKEYSFKNATADDLIECFSKNAKCNLEGYFNAWIKGEVVLY